MAIATTTMKNALVTAYTGGTNRYISIHTADPTTSGGSEATGGSYARVATTWSAASNGTSTGTQVTINVPAGTYTYVGLWDAATGGNFLDKVAITSTTLGAAGQILVTPTYTQT